MSGNSSWRLEAVSDAAQARIKRSFTLKHGENIVGKTKECKERSVFIPSVLCSRNHAKIFVENDKTVTVQDTVGSYAIF